MKNLQDIYKKDNIYIDEPVLHQLFQPSRREPLIINFKMYIFDTIVVCMR